MLLQTCFAVLLSLSMAPGAGMGKQGEGIPFIVVNPDTLVVGESAGILPTLGPALGEVVSLDGGHFAVGVMDLNSGETIVRDEGGVCNMGLPNLVTAACAVDLDLSGEFPIDTLVMHDTPLWLELKSAGQGRLELSQDAIYFIGLDRIRDWLERKGLDDTEINGVALAWAGAPEVDPNTTTAGDGLELLRTLASGLADSDVRRMMAAPFVGTGLEGSIQGDMGFTVYGFSSHHMGGASRAVVALGPANRAFAVLVLADDLCCEEKIDLAFRMTWEALMESL